MEIALQELASRFRLELRGDPATRISGVCSLTPGRPGCISYLSDPKLDKQLTATQSSAVVLRPANAGACRVAALISDNPLLAYTRIAKLWDRRIVPAAGVHSSAFVSEQAQIDASTSIGPSAVVQAGARIGANAEVGPGCVIGHNVQIGAGSRLIANVSIADRVRIGQRVTIEPGVVIGGRGFGLARDSDHWVEVPQLGSVRIGNDVEIGANSTIDRGAIEDTVIEDGVKIDSQVHIGHNCRVGTHTVIAGCSAIAGSVTIGSHCVLAGAVGIVDHVTLGDHVVVTARSLVTRDLDDAGMYSSGWGAMPAPEWRRQVASLRRLSEHPPRRTKKNPGVKTHEEDA